MPNLDPTHVDVELKLQTLSEAMPAKSAIVFGDIFRVEGGYAEHCVKLGCQRVVVVDTLETTGWLDKRRQLPGLDFYKGDFSDPMFMAQHSGVIRSLGRV